MGILVFQEISESWDNLVPKIVAVAEETDNATIQTVISVYTVNMSDDKPNILYNARFIITCNKLVFIRVSLM